jgi:hypothetical protein
LPERFAVYVWCTDFKSTERAVQKAAQMAAALQAEIAVIYPQVVPYPLPLDNPPSLPGNPLRDLQPAIAAAGAQLRVYLCRDPWEALQALPPESLVVIGGRRLWWPFGAARAARRIARAGRQVVFVERD